MAGEGKDSGLQGLSSLIKDVESSLPNAAPNSRNTSVAKSDVPTITQRFTRRWGQLPVVIKILLLMPIAVPVAGLLGRLHGQQINLREARPVETSPLDVRDVTQPADGVSASGFDEAALQSLAAFLQSKLERGLPQAQVMSEASFQIIEGVKVGRVDLRTTDQATGEKMAHTVRLVRIVGDQMLGVACSRGRGEVGPVMQGACGDALRQIVLAPTTGLSPNQYDAVYAADAALVTASETLESKVRKAMERLPPGLPLRTLSKAELQRVADAWKLAMFAEPWGPETKTLHFSTGLGVWKEFGAEVGTISAFVIPKDGVAVQAQFSVRSFDGNWHTALCITEFTDAVTDNTACSDKIRHELRNQELAARLRQATAAER